MKPSKKKLAYCLITLALVTAVVAAPAASAREVSGRVYASCEDPGNGISIDCKYTISNSLLPVSITGGGDGNAPQP